VTAPQNKGMKLTKPGELRSFAAYPRCSADNKGRAGKSTMHRGLKAGALLTFAVGMSVAQQSAGLYTTQASGTTAAAPSPATDLIECSPRKTPRLLTVRVRDETDTPIRGAGVALIAAAAGALVSSGRTDAEGAVVFAKLEQLPRGISSSSAVCRASRAQASKSTTRRVRKSWL
jgi:hypothetical protein